MKIIKRVELAEKIVGQVTCKNCTSILDVGYADLKCQTGFGGEDTTFYGVTFTCPVCEAFQETDVAKYNDVKHFHELAIRKRIQSDSDGK